MSSPRKGQKRILETLRTASVSEPQPIRVLVVGVDFHESGIIELLGRHEQINFEVLSAGSSRECIEAMPQHRPDTLLLGDRLSGDERLELVRQVVGPVDAPPTILLTGPGDDQVSAEAMACGAYACVRKDSADYLTLGRTIHRLLVTYHLEEEERRLCSEVERLTVADELTGLQSRQHLEIMLDSECRRARRYGTQMSFLVIDVDGFELRADRYGGSEADQILRRIANLLSNSVRDTDVLGRHDGDEFWLLMPETGVDGAMQLAERLRFAVAAERLKQGESSEPITVSVGVFAPSCEQELQPEVVVERARAALEEAKASGENRVCAASWRAKGAEQFRRPWGES